MDYPGLSWKPMSDEERRMLNSYASLPEKPNCCGCHYSNRCMFHDWEHCLEEKEDF